MCSAKIPAAWGTRILAAALISSVGLGTGLGAQTQTSLPEQPAGWFGVTITDNAMVDDKFNAFFDSYPVVSNVDPRSPAAKAGVKAGDVLLSFNNRDMRGGAIEMKNWLKPGAPFTLRLRRNDVTREVRGIVGKRPEGWQEIAIISMTPRQEIEGRAGSFGGVPMQPKQVTIRTRTPAPGPLPSVLVPAMGYGGGVYPFAGAEFTALNADLSDALDVKPEGVFVTNVMEGSAARTAGLRGGDIVLKADGIKIEDPMDLVGAIRNADMRNTTSHSIDLQILRRHKLQTLTLRW